MGTLLHGLNLDSVCVICAFDLACMFSKNVVFKKFEPAFIHK